MSTLDGKGLEESALFVKLVNFKWLMAGVGWWVDLSRLQSDMGYAVACLQRALRSDSELLRERSVDLLGLPLRTNASREAPMPCSPPAPTW